MKNAEKRIKNKRGSDFPKFECLGLLLSLRGKVKNAEKRIKNKRESDFPKFECLGLLLSLKIVRKSEENFGALTPLIHFIKLNIYFAFCIEVIFKGSWNGRHDNRLRR